VEVSCELVSSDGSSRVRGQAEKVRDGQYQISYLPQQRGQHHLHIRVGGKHISGSPFPLPVLTSTPTSIITGVRGPWGLAVDRDRQLVVVENGEGCVSLFSGNGKRKRSFGSLGSGPDQLKNPCGVALSGTGDILVADQSNHRIQVFSPDGKSVKCVGTGGSGPLQFSYPVGVAIHLTQARYMLQIWVITESRSSTKT
jgi:DNA-binding beta-propeller fold protein YncE